ncbi:MAG: CDP-diacylglycerol--glycerol-3-phosphate 3-phosphatidyltransferase [Candidatus Methylacidiphilales bacterium]|nr:CDP-diacylglycerol--glycerol-3-phosphate 3-phosphatidyltransferase [Candidatus Methylacidiphilales bacterium]
MNLPNQLTLGRIILCAVLVACMEIDAPWTGSLALVIFIVASLTDWLDGHLARKYHLITDLGKLLDPLADKILISAAYIGLVSNHLAPAWIVSSIIAREFLITGLRTLAAAKGLILAAEKLGKHKTISQITAVIVGLALLAARDLGYHFPLVEHVVYPALLYLALIVTFWSGGAYFWKNRQLVLNHGSTPPT